MRRRLIVMVVIVGSGEGGDENNGVEKAGNDSDINKLNETLHYDGAANFERPRLLLSRQVSHTLPPLDTIVPYLVEAEFGNTVPLRDFTFDNFLISALMERCRPETHTFHLPWGDVTITLQDVAYHLGLPTWCQASSDGTAGGAEEGIVHAEMPPTDDLETLRQYARYYIMLLIGGYLLTDKSNNLVHVRWLLLLQDFADLDLPVTLFGGTAGSHGYRWLHSAADELDYQKFSQWCSLDRGVYQYPLAAKLVGLQQQSRDQHQSRVLHYRLSIDRLRFDERVLDNYALHLGVETGQARPGFALNRPGLSYS
ncbi:uncharacterized protein DS421_8g251880 [Arachis hypogaea]|nr:uncharacterized protein DS421_8g251880 [Arachis hypogaea]